MSKCFFVRESDGALNTISYLKRISNPAQNIKDRLKKSAQPANMYTADWLLTEIISSQGVPLRGSRQRRGASGPCHCEGLGG